MPTIVLFDSTRQDRDRLEPFLTADGLDLVVCDEGGALLESVVTHCPAALVYGLRADIQADLGILHLLRRIAPALPIILLAHQGSLSDQRLLNDVRPIYTALAPPDEQEILAAVRAAMRRKPTRSTPPAA